MPLEEGQKTMIAQVPDNAVFSFAESATHGVKYQRVGKEFWPVGSIRHPIRNVRSGTPIGNVATDTFVKIEKLLTEPLPHVPKAEKLHDFSYFST